MLTMSILETPAHQRHISQTKTMEKNMQWNNKLNSAIAEQRRIKIAHFDNIKSDAQKTSIPIE